MNIVFLEAAVPLTKQYNKSSVGIEKTPYPLVWEFTSHTEKINTLAQLETQLKSHSAKGHCILKGQIARDLVKESRAGSTSTNDTTEWLVLDLDGLPETINMTSTNSVSRSLPLTIDLFLEELGLQDISYIVQWSASYGVENKKLRAHVFMLLDKPYAAPLLKQWLIQKNHEIPLLADNMGLTSTGNSISWPLDISASQNDKLIYIAPPVLKGIVDPMGKTPRIQLVKRKHEKLNLSPLINTATQNRELTNKAIKRLREQAGLPEKKLNYKIVGSTEVLLKPDECTITEMKNERGFVYFNLNGGDSWAYFHSENDPAYIRNFKGEPTYLTKELLPSYWEQLTIQGSSTRTSSNGLIYLAFCDRITGAYWRGTYEPSTDTLDIYQAKNETQLRHFAKQYGVMLGDFVPEWDLVFDPHDGVRVDHQNRRVNKFQPTEYMLLASTTGPKQIPKVTRKVIVNALGDDGEVFDHFINWLATIIQTRDRTLTAWVLHGTTGTGKGILANKILRPLFGVQTTMLRMEELNEKYNSFMENMLLVCVDEVETKALQNERGVMAKLKNFITEAHVSIRQMYSNGAERRNYSNWMFFSNKSDPILVDREDRRYNVARYQANKLQLTPDEIDVTLPKELQAFYNYLVNYPADHQKAAAVIHTADRDTLVSISESSIDTVGNALLGGNFSFFIDQLPTDNSHLRNAMKNNRVEDYREVLKNIMARTMDNGKCNIAREELRTLFDFSVGNIPDTPNKFTSLLKHHRIHMNVVWVNDKSARGIAVKWKDYDKFKKYHQQHFEAAQPAKAAKRAKTPA